jgi:hypothetical protein
MNRGLTGELEAAFTNLISAPKPKIIEQEIYDPNWLAGFVSGEGSYLVFIKKKNLNA